MYKVIIIDDEEFILKGLRQIIDWNSFGCEICAAATSAEEGIERIKEFLPDIVLTDVKMKSMSGLEMIEIVLDIIPHSRFIVMTGYRNFDYAHKALSLGVSEYILKPTSINELKQAIERTVAELDRVRTAERNEREKKEEAETYRQLFEETVLSDIIMYRTVDYDYIYKQFEKYGISFENFFVVSLSCEENEKFDDKELLKRIFSAILQFEPEIYLLKSEKQNELSVVFMTKGEVFDKEMLRIQLENVRFKLSGVLGSSVCMGISNFGNGIKELIQKKQESYLALEEKIHTGVNNVIFYSDLWSVPKKLAYSSIYQQNICESVIAGDENNVHFAMQTASEYLMKHDDEFVRSFCNDTAGKINSYYYSIHFDDAAAAASEENIKRMISECRSREDMIKGIAVLAEETAKRFFKYNFCNIEGTVKKIKEYIEENYQKPITRSDIAEHVHISPSYVSIVFKRIEGKTVMAYITEVRINKAKRLLSEKKYSCQTVSAMVGYNDYSYFANVFKKQTGHSPSEYK